MRLLVLLVITGLVAVSAIRARPPAAKFGRWPVPYGRVSHMALKAVVQDVLDSPYDGSTAKSQLALLKDGCPSATAGACSGNGACTETKSQLFSVSGLPPVKSDAQKKAEKEEAEKKKNQTDSADMQEDAEPEVKAHEKMSCVCRSGFFGVGCQLRVDDLSEQSLHKLVVAGILVKNKEGKYEPTARYQSLARHAFFSKQFGTKYSEADGRSGKNSKIGKILESDQPRERTSLDSFTSPHEEQIMPGSEMYAEYLLKRKTVGEETPHPPPEAEKLSGPSTPPIGLYTSWKGQDIEGPLLYKGQKPWVPADTENKLLTTLNVLQGKTDKFGAPIVLVRPSDDEQKEKEQEEKKEEEALKLP